MCMKSLYNDNGYININKILSYGMPFNFIVGGRGTGKTYGGLKYVYQQKEKFIYMRRLQSQVDYVGKPDFNPFKSINRDQGSNVVVKSITKYNYGFYADPDAETPFGYIAALSTMSNLRGVDMSDSNVLIFDEFIPEKHERPIKNEAEAFFNCYETINRNRELSGKNPLQVLAFANANDLGNPIFLYLNLVSRAEKMKLSGNEIYIDRKRGIGLFILSHSPIGNLKKETALYRLTAGSEFTSMAIENNFYNEKSRSASRPLIEYRPIVEIGEITIYRHKTNAHDYYITGHSAGGSVAAKFSAGDIDRKRFQRAYQYLWIEYMKNRVTFETYTNELLFVKYFTT